MSVRRGRWKRIAATVGVLLPVAAFVVWSSFQVDRIACEVCIRFRGREACRTVIGATREEALRGAIDNACALLASGVTDSIRCSRTPPTRSECRAAG